MTTRGPQLVELSIKGEKNAVDKSLYPGNLKVKSGPNSF